MSSYSFQGRTRVWVPRDEEENRAIFSAMRQETGISMPDEFKPVYLENEEYEVEKWSPKQLIKLLRLYGSHRCLWDHKDPFNKNRKMRKAAMIDITAAMGDDVTMEQVAQKINVIRSTYRYEKRRIKQRIRKGVGARTKLKWFALADSFLRNVPRAEKFKKADASPDSDSDLEDTVVFTIDPEILIPLEEDNSGNQNCISIGDAKPPQVDNDRDIVEINEQMDEIHQMLENHNEDDLHSSHEPWKWKSKQSIKFLRIYREHKCLWDSNDSTYKDRNKRGRAIKAIARGIGGGISEKQVVRKINALRSTYRLERRKLAEAFCKGEAQQSRLKWYPLADSFLRPFCQLKLRKNSGLANFDSEPPQCEFMDENNEPPDNDDELLSDNDDDNDDFNDTHSYDSDDEPIAHLKREPITQIKTELRSEDDKSPTLSPPPKIPKIRIKPIKRPWMQAESIQFVELFRIHGCLWDPQHPNYKKRSDRTVAIEDIAHKMDMPEERIRKKMKILLKAYRVERKKIELAREKDFAYETELVWYHQADEFLAPKEEVLPPIVPMSFVDPDLMSPAPPVFQETNEDKKIKLEAPDSPRDYSSEHFADAVDSPAVNEPPPVSPLVSLHTFPLPQPGVAKPPPPAPSTFTLPLPVMPPSPSSPASFPRPSSLKEASDPRPPSEDVDKKPDSANDSDIWTHPLMQPIKVEEPPEEEFPKPESDEPPTKLVWNGLEDDLLEGKWSLKHSVKFLRLYGAHRCLWDLNDPDYRSRDLRNAAMEDIAAAMGHGLDLEYVSKKIKIFRITYMQHRKRMLEAMKTGQEPEIQLRWFPLADSFLRPHIGLRSIKPGELEMPQFDFQYVYANLNLIDPALLNDFEGKGTQNSIQLGGGSGVAHKGINIAEQSSSEDEDEDDFDDGFFKQEARE